TNAPYAKRRPTLRSIQTSLFAARAAGNGTWATGPARNTLCPNRSSMKKTLLKARGTASSFLWTTTWTTRMTPNTDATAAPETPRKKPRLALAVATALGVGYLPKAPGTFGSLAGVATAYLSAVFFLRPTSFGGLFPLHPDSDAVLADRHFLVPGS